MATVNFVMPAYNAADFIGAAIESVQAQTCSDWELIVCDDASTDNTREIVRSYALRDPRIRFYCNEKNSGNVLLPRYAAITHSDAEWISPLDADDEIEPTYLEQLLQKAHSEHADIIYPTMWKNHERQYLPSPAFDYASRSGRDAMILTLQQWQIGTNGGLIKRSLYQNADTAGYPFNNIIYIDEVYDREIMFRASKVAFSPAKYFYRTNETSVTRKASLRMFDFLISDGVLVDFIRRNYPAQSPTRIAAECHRFERTVEALQILAATNLNHNDRREVMQRVSSATSDIRFPEVSARVSPRQLFVLKNFGPKALYFLYKHTKRHCAGV